jgi:dTDP-4-dehydrorhamnose 3,5-epimerase
MSVHLVTTRRFADARGWFSETFNARRFAAGGIEAAFVQDNHSLSGQEGTLRGIHFQRAPQAQAKLVRCLRGRIYDVAVDLRRASPTFGHWVGAELSSRGGEQLFVPAGFGHAFLTLEPDCEVAYKVDAYYAPEADGGIAWDDPALAIEWPLGGRQPLLSDKDASLPRLADAAFEFPYDGRPLTPLTVEAL